MEKLMKALFLSQSFLCVGAVRMSFLLKESEQGNEKDCWHHKAAQTTALYLEAYELSMTSLQAALP
jgi:hypothetical protein